MFQVASHRDGVLLTAFATFAVGLGTRVDFLIGPPERALVFLSEVELSFLTKLDLVEWSVGVRKAAVLGVDTAELGWFSSVLVFGLLSLFVVPKVLLVLGFFAITFTLGFGTLVG